MGAGRLAGRLGACRVFGGMSPAPGSGVRGGQVCYERLAPVPCRNTVVMRAAAFSAPVWCSAASRAAAWSRLPSRNLSSPAVMSSRNVPSSMPRRSSAVDHRGDLLLLAAGVNRPELADQSGVLAAARGDHAGDAGDALGHGNGVQVGLGEPGGGRVDGDGGQGLQQPLAAREVPVQGRPGHAGRRGDLAHAGRLAALGEQVRGCIEDGLGDPVVDGCASGHKPDFTSLT